ncbi:MAG: hypothetical protein LQ338_000779 [Usnochroma carphineum]|nr:MAG: hypothetical protein LQ338_000779 [Usnochroma carphineum]
MVSSTLALLGVASLAAARLVPRQDPPFQKVPSTAKADNTFSNGAPQLTSEPPSVADIPDPMYGARSIDVPFGRLQHGKMKFFGAGQLNTPTGKTDVWAPGQNDFANQSACGIPDNAFSISKVAIHPYWLKYAPLDRYCMQDVCISFWNEETAQGKQSDMILKVTDVCSTDPNDPTSCATPYDIKVDRTKAQIMEHMNPSDPALQGDEFSAGGTWWFFMKCWADALAQPAYQGSADNWFTTPALPNNLDWAQKTQEQQWKNNQDSYPAKGLPKYPNGAYRMDRNDQTAPPLPDWTAGDADPEWCPVAGGKGWGIPTGKDCSSGQAQGSNQNPAQGSSQSSSQSTSGSTSTTTSAARPANSSQAQAPAGTSSQQPPYPTTSSAGSVPSGVAGATGTPRIPGAGSGESAPKAAEHQQGGYNVLEEAEDDETCEL